MNANHRDYKKLLAIILAQTAVTMGIHSPYRPFGKKDVGPYIRQPHQSFTNVTSITHPLGKFEVSKFYGTISCTHCNGGIERYIVVFKHRTQLFHDSDTKLQGI